MEHELQIRKIGVGIITFSCHKIHFVSIRMVAQTRHSSSSRQLYQTPPAKNRIAAAADLISPPRTTSTHSRTPLPLHVQKQLVIDISQAGGIKDACLKKICLFKPDTYGEPASNLRRRVSQRISYWKALDPAKYQEEEIKLLHIQGKISSEEPNKDSQENDSLSAEDERTHLSCSSKEVYTKPFSSPCAKMSSIGSSSTVNSLFADLDPSEFSTSSLPFLLFAVCLVSFFLFHMHVTDRFCFPLFVFAKLKFM
jgi:hypothetical protein